MIVTHQPIKVPLWADESLRVSSDRPHPPRMDIDQPVAESKGTVLIMPGGGYAQLVEKYRRTAEAFRAAGFDTVVLLSRLGQSVPNRHPAMLHDAQRALRLLRQRGSEWGVHAEQIAVMGFSAGGHLAGSLAVHFDKFASADDDLAEEISARPDAAILSYAVLDMAEEFTHVGSRNHLLGEGASQELRELMSIDRHVSEETPPTFLWHTGGDDGVPPENSVRYWLACRKAGVPVELHVYERGRHGQALTEDPAIRTWQPLAVEFLRRQFEPGYAVEPSEPSEIS